MGKLIGSVERPETVRYPAIDILIHGHSKVGIIERGAMSGISMTPDEARKIAAAMLKAADAAERMTF